MYFRVSPAIARIGFVCVVHNQATFVEQAKSLRRFPVVLVRLRDAVWKVEMTAIEPVVEGKFD